MKRKILLIATMMICVSILATGTYAYFTAEETAHNLIVSDAVSIELREWAHKDSQDPTKNVPFTKAEGVMPGVAVTKIVEVANVDDSSDAWVRMWVNIGISEQGDPISNPMIKNLPLTIEVDGETIDAVELNYNTAVWTYSEEDGYWYYNQALKAGETTEPLFETVTLAKEVGNLYQNSKIIVDVTAQAVQKANNGATVFDAVGWPE